MQKKILEKRQAARFKHFSRKSYGVFNSLQRVVNTGVLAVSTLLFANVATASAQTTGVEQQTPTTDETELDEVVVTSSRVALPLGIAPKVVTVISRSEIERLPFQNVSDLLGYIAGVDIQQRGGHGVQADVSIRGGSYEQTAILLNGINVSNPHTGHFSSNLPINLADIERIEIIHGPSSITYGASAFAGGINIITRKNPNHKAYASLQGGMYGLFAGEGNAVLRSGKATHQLSAGYKRADGDIANSDYRMGNAFWQTHVQTEKARIDFNLGYLDKAFGANTFYSPRFPNQYEKTKNYYASLRAETGTTLKFIPSVYWNRSKDEFQLIKGSESPVPYNHHLMDVYGANLNLQYTSKWGISSFGSELRSEAVQSSNLGNLLPSPNGKYKRAYNRTTISYALEHTLIIDHLSVTAGVLANYNTALHGNYQFYPSVNAAYRFSPDVRIFASWNKAMRMPSFTELFYSSLTHKGNAFLKPERSEAWEVGSHWGNSRSVVSGYTTLFYQRGKDLIDWTKASDTLAVWQSVNYKKVNTKGLELGAKVNLKTLLPQLADGSSLQVDYTKMYQSADAGNNISSYVLNYMRDKVAARLILPIGNKISTSWNWRWQNRAGTYAKYDATSKTSTAEPYPAFSTLDVRLDYRPVSNCVIFANVNNVFDHTYFDLGNVPQAGVWATAGVSYTF